MPNVAASDSSPRAEREAQYQLSVNLFDRTATLLIALLILVGIGVLGLAIVFFANKFDRPIQAIEFVPVEATSPNANFGLAEEPDPPGQEEAPELIEPQLQDTLEALAAMSENQAILSDDSIDAMREASKGKGLGDARQAGPGGDGIVERVPRWERWKIRFEPESSEDFGAWLDQFKIRVGVPGQDNLVHLAYDFSGGAVEVESSSPADYATWGRTFPADGPMPALTRELAATAGIAQHGSLVLLFFPFEVEELLWTLEKEKNPFDDANRIRETVFTVVRQNNAFRFEVLDQKYF